jgi:hypothetical protein
VIEFLGKLLLALGSRYRINGRSCHSFLRSSENSTIDAITIAQPRIHILRRDAQWPSTSTSTTILLSSVAKPAPNCSPTSPSASTPCSAAVTLEQLRSNHLYDGELTDSRDGRDFAAFLDDSVRYGRAAYAVVHMIIDKEKP